MLEKAGPTAKFSRGARRGRASRSLPPRDEPERLDEPSPSLLLNEGLVVTAPMSGQRILGQTKQHFAYGHLLKQGPHIRPLTPEDLNAPPLGSSDGESAKEDSDFEDVRPPKRMKRSSTEEDVKIKSRSSSLPGQSQSVTTSLACEPSNIPPLSFTSSTKLDDADEPYGPFSSQSRSSQPKKTYRRGVKNIHTVGPELKQKKDVKKASKPAHSRGASGFKTRDFGTSLSLADKLEDTDQKGSSFKLPSMPNQSPRSQRAARRSSNSKEASSSTEPTMRFKAPLEASLAQISPVKAAKTFTKPSTTYVGGNSPVTVKAFKSFKSDLSKRDGVGTSDMQDLVALAAEKGNLGNTRARAPEMSATESPFPSINDASSSSALTTPPSSPGVEILEYLRKDSATEVCPVCKDQVDREFLEEFNNGKRLRSRQQFRFCKAHKARSARSEWTAKGFPAIDWSNFDRRLQEYHPIIDDIVKGTRVSFYRNAAEDRMNQLKVMTVQHMWDDTASVDGVSPGYYGSRGARIISENLTSNFASKLRRRAPTDKAISTGGVAAYIQSVLAPELAVLLVMDDMKTDAENARAILKDSTDIGNLVNEEEDDVIDNVEPEEDPLALDSGV